MKLVYLYSNVNDLFQWREGIVQGIIAYIKLSPFLQE